MKHIKKLVLSKNYFRKKDWFGYFLREYTNVLSLPMADLALENFLYNIKNRLYEISKIIGINPKQLHLLNIPKKSLYNDAGAFGLNKKDLKKMRIYFLYLEVNKNLKKELENLYFFQKMVCGQICNRKKYYNPFQTKTLIDSLPVILDKTYIKNLHKTPLN